MAIRRLELPDDEDIFDQQRRKRLRQLPSFRSVVQEAMLAKRLQNAMEPLFRRVAAEEIERVLLAYLQGPQLQIAEVVPRYHTLQLMFTKQLPSRIYTNNKLLDVENNTPEIVLVQCFQDGQVHVIQPETPLKLEIVVLRGDFASTNNTEWTSDEFNRNIVKERPGKRPLLVGDQLEVVLYEDKVSLGKISFTDNSSCTTSGMYKLGVRVSTGTGGPNIKEAVSTQLKVLDQRGEGYQKHYPPLLRDEVWRLDNIGKGGAFEKKLAAEGIVTVQDLLRLYTVNPQELWRIMKMTKQNWEATIEHAKTCKVGNERYFFHGNGCTIITNSICEVQGYTMDGIEFPSNALNPELIEKLALEAYKHKEQLVMVANTQTAPVQSYSLMQGLLPETSSSNFQRGTINANHGGVDSINYETTQNSMEIGFIAPDQNLGLQYNYSQNYQGFGNA